MVVLFGSAGELSCGDGLAVQVDEMMASHVSLCGDISSTTVVGDDGE